MRLLSFLRGIWSPGLGSIHMHRWALTFSNELAQSGSLAKIIATIGFPFEAREFAAHILREFSSQSFGPKRDL